MAVYQEKDKRTWRCVFKYKDWTGKVRITTKRGFARKKDALQYEVDFKNRSAEQADITLETLAEKYLEDYKINKKESSYLAVRARIRHHILPYFANTNVMDITPFKIKEWQNKLIKDGIGTSLTRSVNVSFSALLNYAVKYFGLPVNPFSRTGKTGKIQKRVGFWELEEFLKVAALFNTPLDKAVYNLLFWSGMRIGELEALTPADFDFESNTISISKTYNSATKLTTAPKTPAAIRTISMPVAVMALVQEYFDSVLELPQHPFQVNRREAYRARLAAYARKAGVKHLTLHDLRHSHASYLIRHAVASLPAIAKRLGHSSPTMTLSTYAHVYSDNDSEIANKIDVFLGSLSKVCHDE